MSVLRLAFTAVLLVQQPQCCSELSVCHRWSPEFALGWHTGVAGLWSYLFFFPLPFLPHACLTAASLLLHMWRFPEPLCRQMVPVVRAGSSAWVGQALAGLDATSAMLLLQQQQPGAHPPSAAAGGVAGGRAFASPPPASAFTQADCTALAWYVQLVAGFLLPALFVRVAEQRQRAAFLRAPENEGLVASTVRRARDGRPCTRVPSLVAWGRGVTVLYLCLLSLAIAWQLCKRAAVLLVL
jgi:hypothetical protein